MDTATAPAATRTQKRRKRKSFAEYRTQVKTWFPKASDLPLTHLDKEVAAHVRRRLAPWLGKMVCASDFKGRRGQRLGVEAGTCWEVAQALTMAAEGDAGVKYVEGVWKRSYKLGNPVPHAWVTVDGHRVDLIKEFYSWRCGDDEWDYEPLAEFTYSRLTELYETCPDYADADISTMLWMDSADDRACRKDAYKTVFGPAVSRMMETQAMGQGAAA